MKKVAIISSAALLLFTAAVNAQTDTVPKQNTDPAAQQQPVATDPQQQATAKVYNDKYNNWSSDTYKMQPMPEGLTTEKIFPVIGKYQLTDKDGTQSTVSVSLDESNKGIVWIEGLPQGKIKATLRKSPATYKIPVQPLGEVSGEQAMTTEADADGKTKSKATKTTKEVKAKELPEGVLIYDKDANVLNVCIGCKYNNEDPTAAFTASTTEEDAVADETSKTTKKTAAKKPAKKKVAKVKPVHYTGTKVIEEAEAAPAPATEAQQ
jgi:hypothetical protein